MEIIYSILIDIGVLCFFGFLFYLFQRSRILKNSEQEIKAAIQKLSFDIHHYLNDKMSETYYEELNSFAIQLEQLLDSKSIHEQKDQLESPKSLPDYLSQDLETIKNMF